MQCNGGWGMFFFQMSVKLTAMLQIKYLCFVLRINIVRYHLSFSYGRALGTKCQPKVIFFVRSYYVCRRCINLVRFRLISRSRMSSKRNLSVIR